MFTTNRSKGFTLLELLIALTISIMVLTGVYRMFDSLIITKAATESAYYENNLLLSARSLIKPDMLQMHDKSLGVKHDTTDTLNFRSNNSIKMEKAFPVDISYYVEDGYLYRKESSSPHDYEWTLKLMGNVDKFQIESHNGYRFTEETDTLDTIIKVTMSVSGQEIVFIAGTGRTSKSADYLGDTWQ